MVEIRYLSADEFPCTQVIIAAGGEALVLKPSEVLEMLEKLKQDSESLAAALMSERTSTPCLTPFALLPAMLAASLSEEEVFGETGASIVLE